MTPYTDAEIKALDDLYTRRSEAKDEELKEIDRAIVDLRIKQALPRMLEGTNNTLSGSLTNAGFGSQGIL